MGKRGPARKPSAVAKRDGTFRSDRHSSAALPVEAPPMPGDLAPAAQAFWNVATKGLEEAGLIARLDGQALRLGADSWRMYLLAHEEIENRGVVIESATKYGVVRKGNPACLIRASAWKEVMRVLTQFGMTPSSRTGLPFGLSDSGDDEETRVAKILGLHQPGA